MIYIAAATSSVYLRLPRTCSAAITGARLSLVSTVGRKKLSIRLISISVDGDYYAIQGDFSAVKTSGEYEYRLTAGGANLGSGVAVIGKIPTSKPEQYVKEIEFEQYEQN